jgi:hypothetical protein
MQGYFYAWSRGGIFASLNDTLVMASREAGVLACLQPKEGDMAKGESKGNRESKKPIEWCFRGIQ